MDKATWLIIGGMTVVTVLPRILPILLLSDRRLPPVVERWLSLIAPAILAALLLPELILDRSTTPATLLLSTSNTFLLAGIPTFLVAWKTGSLFGTVIVGIASAALLRLMGL